LEKLSNLEHKFLFYFGSLVVILFLSLSYWQFNSYLQDKETIQKIIDTENPTPVTLSDIHTNNQQIIFEYNNLQIIDGNELDIVKTWYLRSRVHNEKNGYHLVTLYKHNVSRQNILVKNGWVPLDKNIDKTFLNKDILFIGRLIDYDRQTFGQDDIPNSEYLFRVDKEFIENETQTNLPNFYITLTKSCGSGVECINLTDPYDAPHLSYSFQWLFFAVCLIIVIFRKNKII
jgi:cytochrome oxidase assembly protein ShyY1